MEFTRVKNDVNGNGRLVVHFLALNTPAEPDPEKHGKPWSDVSDKYNLALARARKIGGRKFHNKQYGGGIVFQAYGEAELEQDIINLLAKG